MSTLEEREQERRFAQRLLIGAFIVRNLKGRPRPDWLCLPKWRGWNSMTESVSAKELAKA